MRFSLKDLMWSVTLASLGLASIAIALHPDVMEVIATIPYSGPMLFALCGAFFGAAIGVLFHRPWIGALVGTVAFIVMCIGLVFYLMG